ncbi:MAG: hypothetical protein CMJ94_14400 [Planctomycetes bacterium]|nr:hypothetical protein [Planctomycetota bacterium]
MIALTLLCAPLLQQVDFDPTYDPFQTTAGRLQQGSGGQGTAATSGCDHFNRANNFDLGANWSEEAGDMEIRSEFLHPRQNNSLAVMNGVNANYKTSKASCSFQTNGQKLYYVALVAGYKDLDNCVHVKVQDGDYDTLVDKVYFRYGNNKAPWNANHYVFDLATPTALGTMELSFRNNGDVARLEIDNAFSGEVEVFECSGLSSKANQLGTGFGISMYGDCFADDFIVNDGDCPEGFQLTVSGTPGSNMTFTVEGATPNEQVALVFGFGLGSFSIPFGFPCAGTQLGIASPQDFKPIRADLNGTVILTRPVPASAAGLVVVQAVDLIACEVTDPISL